MKDRLIFDRTILSNGMRVYSQLDETVSFAQTSLLAPVGSAHNHGDVIPGSYHYLEHLLMKRSDLYPKNGSLKELVSQLGGRFGASTSFAKTSYDLIAISRNFPDMFKGVVSHFARPILLEEDVQAEAGVIANERNRKAAFYPGTNERSRYLATEWLNDSPYSIEQVFGSNEDFKKMNAVYFNDLHKRSYLTDQSYCVIAGNFDLDFVCNELAQLPLQKNISLPTEKFTSPSWNKKDYHEIATSETDRFEYCASGFTTLDPTESFLYLRMLSILNAMLCDYSYGALMKWLRHEKNWCYEITPKHEVNRGFAFGGFMIPLNSREQVLEVRRGIHERMLAVVTDGNLLERVKQHKKNTSAFWYQTVDARMSSAMRDLHLYGTIETEEQYFASLDAVTSNKLEEFFSNKLYKNFGELVFTPAK